MSIKAFRFHFKPGAKRPTINLEREFKDLPTARAWLSKQSNKQDAGVYLEYTPRDLYGLKPARLSAVAPEGNAAMVGRRAPRSSGFSLSVRHALQHRVRGGAL